MYIEGRQCDCEAAKHKIKQIVELSTRKHCERSEVCAQNAFFSILLMCSVDAHVSGMGSFHVHVLCFISLFHFQKFHDITIKQTFVCFT